MGFTVAIDGPAAAGKGTISKAVAAHFGFAHLDTGLLYRAVGARVLAGESPAEAALSLTADDLKNQDLRTPEVAQAASKVAVLQEVRQALVEFQRRFARSGIGAVLDGRDIGTVICPDAEIKLFVTASADIRAQRRYSELQSKGHDVEYETVLADVIARDKRDADRQFAPMIAAEDAIPIDTSDLTAEEATMHAIRVIAAHPDLSTGESA